MEILEELEPVRRGPYTGAPAWIGPDGAIGSSILIRTFVADGRRLTLHVGGGITWRSDPAAEWAETVAKARGPLRAIGGARSPTDRWRPWHVWLDGRLVPAGGPHLIVSDRGFQLGRRHLRDAAGAARDRPIELDEHLARLRESAAAPGDPARPTTIVRWSAGIDELLAAEGLAARLPEACRATRRSGSRSAAGRSSAAACSRRARGRQPTVVIQAWPFAPPPPELPRRAA